MDISIQRSNDERIEFDFHRKDTCTDRYIPIESNQHPSHKLAAFDSMIHRLVNVPLWMKNFANEKHKILHIAEVNGVSADIIVSLIKKHSRKMLSNERTKLCNQTKKIWCYTRIIAKTKDKRNQIDKPGEYKATCSNCGDVYIVQTGRSLKMRMRWHLNDNRNGDANIKIITRLMI